MERWQAGTGKFVSLAFLSFLGLCLICVVSGCGTTGYSSQGYSDGDLALAVPLYHGQKPYYSNFNQTAYVNALPQRMDTQGRKLILIDPEVHAWGAYDESGMLVRGGIATAGASYCPDLQRPCKTSPGKFRIYSLGGPDCISKRFPLGEGGAFMPYCMFFNGGQSLHGSPDQIMAARNISHGCVHLRIPDAAWLRYQFADVGTRVIVRPY